jgi:hypothetical protein
LVTHRLGRCASGPRCTTGRICMHTATQHCSEIEASGAEDSKRHHSLEFSSVRKQLGHVPRTIRHRRVESLPVCHSNHNLTDSDVPDARRGGNTDTCAMCRPPLQARDGDPRSRATAVQCNDYTLRSHHSQLGVCWPYRPCTQKSPMDSSATTHLHSRLWLQAAMAKHIHSHDPCTHTCHS